MRQLCLLSWTLGSFRAPAALLPASQTCPCPRMILVPFGSVLCSGPHIFVCSALPHPSGVPATPDPRCASSFTAQNRALAEEAQRLGKAREQIAQMGERAEKQACVPAQLNAFPICSILANLLLVFLSRCLSLVGVCCVWRSKRACLLSSLHPLLACSRWLSLSGAGLRARCRAAWCCCHCLFAALCT